MPCKHVIVAVKHDADNTSAPSILEYFRQRWLRSTAKAGVIDCRPNNDADADSGTDADNDNRPDNDGDAEDAEDSDASTDDRGSEQQARAAVNECFGKLVAEVGMADTAAFFASISAAISSEAFVVPRAPRTILHRILQAAANLHANRQPPVSHQHGGRRRVRSAAAAHADGGAGGGVGGGGSGRGASSSSSAPDVAAAAHADGGGSGRTLFNQPSGYNSLGRRPSPQYGTNAVPGAKRTLRISTHGRNVRKVGHAVICTFCSGHGHHRYTCPTLRVLGSRLWCIKEDVAGEIKMKLNDEALDPSTVTEVERTVITTTYLRINLISCVHPSVGHSS